jgi:hypothetical protein
VRGETWVGGVRLGGRRGGGDVVGEGGGLVGVDGEGVVRFKGVVCSFGCRCLGFDFEFCVWCSGGDEEGRPLEGFA